MAESQDEGGETNRFNVGRTTGQRKVTIREKHTACGDGDGDKHELLWLLIAAVTLLIWCSRKTGKKKIRLQQSHYSEGQRTENTSLLSPPLPTSEDARVHPRVEIMCEMMFHY